MSDTLPPLHEKQPENVRAAYLRVLDQAGGDFRKARSIYAALIQELVATSPEEAKRLMRVLPEFVEDKSDEGAISLHLRRTAKEKLEEIPDETA
ncbi:MAG: hypothetical protein OEY44_01470 [Candidatus Peregrinibacteria bacterium]|nr:hypothetical protein [Candidatus Peregrinibacteria bacterium]